MIAVRDHLDRFGDADIAVVTFGTPAQAASHRSHLDLPFPILADPDRAVYRRFGLERGTRRQVWNAGSLRMYAELIRQGRRWRTAPLQDVRQLGGDFVIDGVGRLAAAFRPPSPDARPTVNELVDAVDRARG